MKRLRMARIEKEINQQELANLTGIKLRTIRSYETGQASPPIKNLVKLADALGTSTDYLLGRI